MLQINVVVCLSGVVRQLGHGQRNLLSCSSKWLICLINIQLWKFLTTLVSVFVAQQTNGDMSSRLKPKSSFLDYKKLIIANVHK